jgi:hypothetical protein
MFGVVDQGGHDLCGKVIFVKISPGSFNNGPGYSDTKHGGYEDALITFVVKVAGIVVSDCRSIVHCVPPGNICMIGLQTCPHQFRTDIHEGSFMQRLFY